MERSGLDRWCYALGAALALSGVAGAIGWLVRGGAWDGPVSLRKAVTFGLAFGLTVVTVTWLSAQLRMPDRRRVRVLLTFTAACVLEVVLVGEQSWRGVPSHFNRDSPVDSVVSTVLAVGGAVIVLCALLFAWAVLRMPDTVPALLRLAIRAGFVGFLLALGAGVAMVVRGVTLEGSEGATAAYDGAGAFKPVHATTMHAILVLPLIAWLLLRTGWPARTRQRLLWAAIGGYALTTVVVLVDTLLGVEPFTAQAAAVTAMVVGGVVTAAVGAAALLKAAAPSRHALSDSSG